MGLLGADKTFYLEKCRFLMIQAIKNAGKMTYTDIFIS